MNREDIKVMVFQNKFPHFRSESEIVRFVLTIHGEIIQLLQHLHGLNSKADDFICPLIWKQLKVFEVSSICIIC